MKKKPPRTARRSLRSILVVWFILFSVVPVAFVTGYSVLKYEQAIDNELAQRLAANAREIDAILDDFKSSMMDRRNIYAADTPFIYTLSTGDVAGIRRTALDWLKADISTSLTFFNRQGRMLASVYRDDQSRLKDFVPSGRRALVLAQENLDKLRYVNEYALVEHSKNGRFSLILFSKLSNAAGKHVGYLEQSLDLDSRFLIKQKERMKLELMILRPTGAVSAATLPDFSMYEKGYFEEYTKALVHSFFDLDVRGEPHGFLVYPMSFGNSDFFLALGASKRDAKAVLRNVNLAFYVVVATVLGLLIIMIWVSSNAVLKPLQDLVAATQNIQNNDSPVEIPVTSETEIGLLTESFNTMSRNIARARAELKNKIIELEKANLQIKDTQTKLVHNSKMISLGQLVAGVAHELNNPIGFIYSNMSHLRDYAEKLMRYAEEAERNPHNIHRLQKELDIDFIKEDLPKLVRSCEDGARRTRDIVLGLRNFSRLEAAELKELDIHESLESTLNLIKGEIKGRIEIERNFGSIPKVKCFSSQINQVFMNLLSNAVQAIEGSGRIWITTKITRVRGKGEMVVISIQDSGKGMTPEVQEKIFDPFFSTKGVGQGTGLGLSITYGIVLNHGGDIQVKSQPGTGTEFIVMIPVKPDESVLKASINRKAE
ncbi:MAG: HAMP domain-containing histidine kinase [Bdellovibrionaceae bacterium]|nr:HAMP domain-containing histidine kinase [Pseudobdellovibrionaceae bacterium]